MEDANAAPPAQSITLGQAAAAELAGAAAAPSEPPPGYAVLTKDVEGVGCTGQVVCARAARIAGLVAASQARAATQGEVELAAPFHLVLKD